MLTGVIVAGGYSTRFGDGDKAVVDIAGQPMVRRVANRIAPVIDTLVVNCRSEQVDTIEDALAGYEHSIRVAPDPEPDQGPITGIRTGLTATDSEYAAVVACDMPAVSPDLLSVLFDRASGTDGAVPQIDGYSQPLQAVYHVSAMVDACGRTLAAGSHRLLDALDRLDLRTVSERDWPESVTRETFRNINTREDRREFESD